MVPMTLDPDEREYVVSSVVDILRHRKRERLLQILRKRLALGDYDAPQEKDLDQAVLALAQSVAERLHPRSR